VSRRARLLVFAVSAAGLAPLLLWGLAGLHDFGHYPGPYGDVLNQVAVGERHATNVVAAVVFDYRGVDTLGEEYILFCSVIGVALLLREVRDREAERPRDAHPLEVVRAVGALLVGPTVLLGLYVVAFGYLTPGGGFQGGVVLASGLLLVYLAGTYRAYREVSPAPLVELGEGVGAGAYVAVGLLAMALGQAFLENFLPLGTVGTLLSSGSIPLLNWASGLEVAAALVLLFGEFLEEVMLPPRRRVQ
jgi:multicomponent Na+:H+ antiporter subunit B